MAKYLKPLVTHIEIEVATLCMNLLMVYKRYSHL